MIIKHAPRTPEEEELVRQMRLAHSKWKNDLLERQMRLTRDKWKNASIPAGKPWTSVELAMLKKAYENQRVDLRLLAKALKRTYASVALKASRLGLGNFSRPKQPQLSFPFMPNNKSPIFQNKDERGAWQSKITKARLKKNGHPRGMLGKTHSSEARAAISASFRARWADPSNILNSEAFRAERSARWARMKADGMLGISENTYSRAARGRRPDLGDTFFRSSWEANYARFLNWRVSRREIASWEYEPQTFWFLNIARGTRSYLPDFKVTNLDGSHEWHEVKGWMDPKSITKLGRMAKYYPDEKLIVIDQSWFKSASKTLAYVIPGWERKPNRRKK